MSTKRNTMTGAQTQWSQLERLEVDPDHKKGASVILPTQGRVKSMCTIHIPKEHKERE